MTGVKRQNPVRLPEEIEFLHDGEWWSPSLRGSKLVCCDCDLVHDIFVRLTDGGIELRFDRNVELTKAIRRKGGKKRR